MKHSRSFVPSPENARAFRDALGQFGTGVTVVTAMGDDGPVGMTANSFASISMEPPLVMWSPAKASRRFRHFAAAQHFAIHVLSETQAQICMGFARTPDMFDRLDWHASPEGVPLLEGCLSRFECVQSAVHDAGDHAIVVGEVMRTTTTDGAPLLFYKGRIGGFAQTG
ncbi:flavin reductase family protein [Paracoccus sediminicola]|uniref:flavin reductase family protein n=1 Tax=Paracoccus sediminicola TaxID=3017783 RepID=UPI0022F0EA22|nr:flavin reductase family protein [Paracoccus sediminicola]WBU57855.1 flavin reductase family protein [Paracoccus sediminicola]